MKESVLALLAGLVVGAVFTLLKLPIPAPPVLSGVLGIVGVYSGGVLMQRLLEWFNK
ncbi:XapX domain-containing protein [Paenibacillus xerothermodurans]|uniref:DUF1427 family protein n=1 Tax=Paenibacillus xerothermodurans TaxID=1977292 RepID=A0A2W1NCE0_PAEXE|nr:DUF1427 family protein [Paenibacillus xerothermodurans]PZE22147.1 DUF1427 family protein [Paenibacillus xerothermodurans]